MNKFESEFEKSLKNFNKRDFHIILEKYEEFKDDKVDLTTFISMLNLHYLHEVNHKFDRFFRVQDLIMQHLTNTISSNGGNE
ncbi:MULTISPECIES: hypothetical protein [Chryseobacterium]|uniref:Uncharacterized protein n=1 Tax=Chryseobacterium camelliae TaxID=1265445 RepID=A0ABU0TDX0_9FLAO|nr:MULTISPECIES: hypothetical protein [Chryseobacterium]MDT3407017.1 hypothetical protein [Pseudacidovorax intermedius]MDQ1095192.1 hypothetical protein [Chryseobacterium camelliae]MDQ1099129.1 hypothetical protein [Chryseobacterium sp. SORGH_AS_1048]MDR6086478.1 hypothetical protein [Chryseobacterium sp. SORGH_AS_0909]MDR6130850.1 hypothetical protein [Chryseobacterium sp. SORGH_AS_1175]